jgi:FG-GAP-like repeat/Cep192 domain 4
VSVLLGGPGGGFGAQTAYPARNGPIAVAVDDFDHNGDPDLAAANHYSDNLSVLPGGAGGSFGAQTVIPVGDEPRSVAVGDFDGDGDPDLAVANFLGPVSVLANTTSGVGLDQADVAFPPTAAGSESAAQTVRLKNYGGGDVSVSGVALAGADAGGFVLADDACSGATLTTGETCSVSVRFHPGRVGTHSARLEFTDDAPGNPHSAALSGTGTPPVALSPSSIAWKPRPDSTESTYRIVTLTNLGEVDLAVDQVALGGADASSFRLPSSYDHCTDTTVPSAQTCTVKVRFRPDGVGPKTARLVFTDDAVTSPQRIQLSGTGTPGPWLTPSVGVLKFGQAPVGTTTATKAVTLTNTGSAAMKITAISVGGANPGDFVGLSQNCTALASLGPDESCSAQIAFRPTATGARQARLTIDDTAPRNPHHVDLQGTGT